MKIICLERIVCFTLTSPQNGNVMCMFTEYSPLKKKMDQNLPPGGTAVALIFSASTKDTVANHNVTLVTMR